MWLKNREILLDDDVNIIISTDSDEDNNNYTTTLMILDSYMIMEYMFVVLLTEKALGYLMLPL